MCGKILWKIVFLVILLEFQHIYAYNLSPVPNLVLKRPNFQIYKNKIRSSYFGFTVVLREKSAFISAPRDQPSFESQAQIDEPGAIYKCTIDVNDSNLKQEDACKPFSIETKGNILKKGFQSEIRDNQWMGAAMVGGPRHSDPFVICAPRFVGGHDLSLYESYMHGICYLVMNTTTDRPTVEQIKSLNIAKRQSRQVRPNVNGFDYQLGQQGFSAHITRDNKEIVMGAPGILGWKGSVIRYNKQTKKSNVPQPILNHFSYFGYDVSSGYLESRETKKILYVATSIHSADTEFGTYDGEVIVFDYTPNGEIERKFIRHGQQFGELFGYALIVEDITDDSLDDLIVSAPLHQVDGFDVGVVYVYVNDEGLNFRDAQIITSPFKTQARFGTTMSKLGDINKDGYNDIAIAAPFVDGHGAVAIYLGGPDGLQIKPSIILGMDPPIQAKMFGHGLSNGFDIDGNGFNDLAVGAPDSEYVYIYRAYPIVYVEVSIKAEKQSIEVQQNETHLELEFCYKITTKAKKINAVELTLEIRVDPVYKRMVLDNKTSQTSFRVNATQEGDCQYNKMTIKNSTAYIFTPMTQHINYTLVHDAEKYFSEEFCNNCVVLDSSSRREDTSEVRFKHGCAGKACEVDLKVSALKVPSTFVLGTSNILFATYLIENFGENAYYTKVEFSSPFPFAKIPPNCRPDLLIETKLSCTPDGPANFIGNTTIELGFDVKSVQEVKAINITAKASSEGHEKTKENNSLNNTIIFQAQSAFEIVGQPNKTFESVYDEKDMKDVIYKFELQNNGPSSLHNVKLVILLPFTAQNKKNETINFIDLERSRATLIRDEIQDKNVLFSKKPLETSSKEISYNKIFDEYVNTEDQILATNNTISLFCNQTNALNCGLAKLTIIALRPKQKFNVNLNISLDSRAVRKVLGKELDYLQAYMDVLIEPSSKKYVTLNITKIMKPLTLVNIGPEKTPFWVYIAAAVGGLIFLLLLALVLKKLGFFKRQTKEEMEELVNEKIEKQRMKVELEQTDLENEEDKFFVLKNNNETDENV